MEIASVGKDVKKLKPSSIAGGLENGAVTVSSLGGQIKMCTGICTVASFTGGKGENKPKAHQLITGSIKCGISI